MNVLIRFIIIFFCLQISQNLLAQTGFKYQAVIRDNAGQILANQSVSMRIGIIQDAINNAVSYQETHAVTSNPYGVVHLNIGEGTAVLGTFAALDWSKESFAQIELDIDGGSAYQLMGTSELLAVPKALYAETAGKAGCSDFGICVKDFGAIGDNTTDDTNAFQNALNAAEMDGNRVIVPAGNYKITQTLVVPKGVMLVGEGTGASALGTPFNGAAIRYAGTGAAVEFPNDNSGMRDMLVYDQNQGSQNADGIHILADGEGVESLRFFNVLIHFFIGGTALKLDAINGGSNVWHHGVVSGGGFDYCLRVTGGNNNQFYGTIFEPFQSTQGHIIVEEGEIQCYEIRIEAQTQPSTIPVVQFESGTRNSFMNGLFAHGQVLDKGDNHIAFRAQKATFYADSQRNLFENANFYGFENDALPYWDIQEDGGSGTIAAVLAAELTPENKVLKLTVPAGVTTHLEQSVLQIPVLGDLPLYEQVHFGFFVKTNQAGLVFLRNNAPAGVVSSAIHPGDNEWHFIGMTALTNTTTTMDARLSIANTTGSPVDVFISCPTMNFGNQIPDIAPKPISSAGGILTGTLTTGMVEFMPTTNFIVLPQEANTFVFTGTQTVTRINDSGADRFPKGTVITLLFNDAGMGVSNTVFIALKSGFTSTANSSLMLISNGNGTWREVMRNL